MIDEKKTRLTEVLTKKLEDIQSSNVSEILIDACRSYLNAYEKENLNAY